MATYRKVLGDPVAAVAKLKVILADEQGGARVLHFSTILTTVSK